MRDLGRKRIVFYLVLALLGLGWVSWFPLHSRLTQLVFLGCLGALVLLSILLVPRAGRARFAGSGLLASAGLGALLFLDGRPVDAASFQRRFVENLEAQVGRSYYWGGESVSGVDCSGLPRRAYRAAGWMSLNPALWREAIDNWLFDASASAMKVGYRGKTVPVGLAVAAIVEIDHSRLKPGDLAVTENGIHMLVYLGEHRWIQADPGKMEVIVEDSRETGNHWMQTPVEILRWRILAED